MGDCKDLIINETKPNGTLDKNFLFAAQCE